MRQGVSVFTAPATSNLAWSFHTQYAAYGGVVVSMDETLVYTGNAAGILFAVEVASGSVKWQYQVPSLQAIQSTPGVSPQGGAVVFGGQDSTVYALDGAAGTLIATFTADAPLPYSPVFDAAGTVFICSTATLFALVLDVSGQKLTQRWKFATGTNHAGPTYFNRLPGHEYVLVTGPDCDLFALNAVDGTTQWQYSICVQAPAMVHQGYVIGCSVSGYCGIYDSTGSTTNALYTNGVAASKPSGLSFSPDFSLFYVADNNNHLDICYTSNASIQWYGSPFGLEATGMAVDAAGTVVMSHTGGVASLSGNALQLNWDFNNGDTVPYAAALLSNSTACFVSSSGWLRCIH